MKPVIDPNKEYGLVLEGGGAKGAYQIGAWKALRESGVKIKGVSGTSVGALNGALICMGDLENAEKIWDSISYSRVMDVDDDTMKNLLDMKLKVKDFLEFGLKYIRDGGMNVAPLKKLIEEAVDPQVIMDSPMEFYVQTFSVDFMQELHVDMKEIGPELIRDMLLASAYMFPVFKTEKLHGNRYIDGGFGDNVPVSALLDRDYKDIIVIRIYGIGHVKPVKVPEDVNVITVVPRADLGTIMDFDAEKSHRNMIIGYFDTMRAVYGLKGRFYYIDENHDDAFYLEKLVSGRVEGDSIRTQVEKVLPKLALELKLGADWTYTELYLVMLEISARLVRVPKYKIYTVEELLEAVQSGSGEQEMKELPQFAQMFLDR